MMQEPTGVGCPFCSARFTLRVEFLTHLIEDHRKSISLALETWEVHSVPQKDRRRVARCYLCGDGMPFQSEFVAHLMDRHAHSRTRAEAAWAASTADQRSAPTTSSS